MTFTDPVSALEHVEHNHTKYKLVLSDVKMPVMDGIELTKRIADKDGSIVLLLMSAFDRPEVLSKVDGMEIDFIQKPVPMEKLRQIISSKLGY
jgi:DNA-binding NtrC family response regulator